MSNWEKEKKERGGGGVNKQAASQLHETSPVYSTSLLHPFILSIMSMCVVADSL